MLMCLHQIWYYTIVHGQICLADDVMSTSHAMIQYSVTAWIRKDLSGRPMLKHIAKVGLILTFGQLAAGQFVAAALHL